LPSERELSSLANVSRSTVRKALKNLMTEGYCEIRQGKGIYVTADKIQVDIQGFSGFSELMKELGHIPDTRIIEKKVIKANEIVANKLEISKGSQVLYLKRLRLINNEPSKLEITYLPLSRMEGLEKFDFQNSLYKIIKNNYNKEPCYAKGFFNIKTADAECAHLLNISLNSPILEDRSVAFDNENLPIEYVIGIYRSDKFEFYAEARRTPRI